MFRCVPRCCHGGVARTSGCSRATCSRLPLHVCEHHDRLIHVCAMRPVALVSADSQRVESPPADGDLQSFEALQGDAAGLTALPAIMPCTHCASEGRVWDRYFHLWRTCSWCRGEGRLFVGNRAGS